ncbi:hypothetical protein DPMN_180389 [Dreissena polymorpha]|uniref:Uncharacterized protein n=1 Tax=Dreissena polymorpha TaxID=45954 RepID=A0A9D4IN76_DREPO|nr:hypothetical protein DPMN_180389 [Dreissena polymorpha]
MGHVLPAWGEIVPEEACLGEKAEPVVMVVFCALYERGRRPFIGDISANVRHTRRL